MAPHPIAGSQGALDGGGIAVKPRSAQQHAPGVSWRVSSFECKCAGDGSPKLRRLLDGADASGAKALGNSLIPFHDLHFLDIDVPTAAGRLAGPRSVVTKLRAAATTLTLRHDEAPLPDLLTAQLAQGAWICGARA